MSDKPRTRLSWKPVRRGILYCAPACGARCTWEGYLDARKAARALVKELGPEWRARVFENLGWYFEARTTDGIISVCRSGDGWMCFLEGGRWTGRGSSPSIAVRDAFVEARCALSRIEKVIAYEKRLGLRPISDKS